MNKKNVIQDFINSTTNIIKLGKLNEKVLLRLKMDTSLYDYIEVVTNYFDDEDRPNLNTWQDAEGMGYGWRWRQYEEKDWHKMMGKIVSEECEGLLDNIDNISFFIYKKDDCKVYHFISQGEYRVDTVVTLSNEEIWF